jgi:tripartite-type tricarboxylate transporter receptor subunit TctC
MWGWWRSASAQTWPDRPIKLVVPYPPGGLTDTLARAISEPLAKALGQPIVIDNKPGVGTLLGAQTVARSPADGTTLLMATSTTLGVSPALYRNGMIDPVRDFTPVSLVASVPFFLVASADTGWLTAKDLVDAARLSPSPLQYGSAGNGSPHHLAMEMLQKATGVTFEHVPYKGSQLAIPDLLGGRFKLMVTDLTPAIAHIERQVEGASHHRTRRSAMLPDAPSPRPASTACRRWPGKASPAGTESVIDGLAAEINRIVASDELSSEAAIGCDMRCRRPRRVRRAGEERPAR